MPTVMFILGSRTVHTGAIDVEPAWAHSEVYICQKCGEAWGRLYIEGKDWRASVRPCEQHTPANRGNAGGTFSDLFRPALTKAMNRELLVREFMLLWDDNEWYCSL